MRRNDYFLTNPRLSWRFRDAVEEGQRVRNTWAELRPTQRPTP